jgi:hypothetical protein
LKAKNLVPIITGKNAQEEGFEVISLPQSTCQSYKTECIRKQVKEHQGTEDEPAARRRKANTDSYYRDP